MFCAAWGAASFTYTAPELRQLGIFEPAFERLYDRVAEIVGVSGDPEDDASDHCFAGVAHHHHYAACRAVADLVADDLLCLGPDEASSQGLPA